MYLADYNTNYSYGITQNTFEEVKCKLQNTGIKTSGVFVQESPRECFKGFSFHQEF